MFFVGWDFLCFVSKYGQRQIGLYPAPTTTAPTAAAPTPIEPDNEPDAEPAEPTVGEDTEASE